MQILFTLVTCKKERNEPCIPGLVVLDKRQELQKLLFLCRKVLKNPGLTSTTVDICYAHIDQVNKKKEKKKKKNCGNDPKPPVGNPQYIITTLIHRACLMVIEAEKPKDEAVNTLRYRVSIPTSLYLISNQESRKVAG